MCNILIDDVGTFRWVISRYITLFVWAAAGIPTDVPPPNLREIRPKTSARCRSALEIWMVLIKQTRFAIWPYNWACLMNTLAHKHACALLTRLSSLPAAKALETEKQQQCSNLARRLKELQHDWVPRCAEWRVWTTARAHLFPCDSACVFFPHMHNMFFFGECSVLKYLDYNCSDVPLFCPIPQSWLVSSTKWCC